MELPQFSPSQNALALGINETDNNENKKLPQWDLRNWNQSENKIWTEIKIIKDKTAIDK